MRHEGSGSSRAVEGDRGEGEGDTLMKSARTISTEVAASKLQCHVFSKCIADDVWFDSQAAQDAQSFEF